MSRYFITATDTDAGKTLVASSLLQAATDQGYSTLGFKPVASGCELTADGLRNADALQLIQASSIKLDYRQVNPYAFAPAIAPHIAAQQVEIEIQPELIVKSIHKFQDGVDFVLVEGVGGWLVPLSAQQTVADLARMLNYRIILVVAMKLGCINHALLTVQAIQLSGLTLHGWIANSTGTEMLELEENIATLKQSICAPLLGILPYMKFAESDRRHYFEVGKFI